MAYGQKNDENQHNDNAENDQFYFHVLVPHLPPYLCPLLPEILRLTRNTNQFNEGRTKSRQLQVHQMCMKVGKRKIRKPEQGTGVHSCTYFLPKLFSNSTNKTYLHRCTERGRGGHHSGCFNYRQRIVASIDLHISFGELLEIQHCPPCQRCQLEVFNC